MLDNETKRRIDTARDILVGKVPDPKSQVEQITIALIYKFMDDMDKEAVSFGGKPTFFTGEYEKYSWTKIFDAKLGGLEMLNLYSEAILKLNINPNIPQLFRDIFKNAYLPYRDPETLKLFLKTINDFNYDHSERLGDSFEYLLSVLGSQGDAGQFRTPRHIIDFIVAVLAPQKGESICDPACGTAGFLISSYKYILQHNTNKNKGDNLNPADKINLMQNLAGYDISPDMVRLSLVNMYLHGFTTPKIYEYDTLTSEDRWNEYYDIILANPPFMTPKGGIKPHKKFSVQATKSEVLFTDYIAEHINPTTGRAGLIVPNGIVATSQTAYKDLRKLLVKQSLIAVISLPAGCFQPYSGVKTSILILDRRLSKKTDNILFIKVANDGFDLGAQRKEIEKNDLPLALQIVTEYKTCLANDKLLLELPSIATLVQKQTILENKDLTLSADRYLSTETNQLSEFSIVNINHYCDFKRGTSITKKDIQDGIIPVIAGGQQAAYFHNVANRPANTITISSSGAYAGFVNFHSQPIFASDCFTVTPKNKEVIDVKYLFNLLKSKQEEIYTFQEGGAQPHIYPKIFELFDIPLPPIEIQQQIVNEIEGYQKIINGAKQVVNNYKPTITINPVWEMVELAEVCKPEYGFTETAKENGNARFIRITDIGADGKLIDTDAKYVELTEDAKQSLVKIDDILVARTGATYGKTMIFDKGYPAVFASFLIRLNFDISKIYPKYYWVFSQSENYLDQAKNLMTGTGQPQFNGNAIIKIQIPIPPLEEQMEIVKTIEEEMRLVEQNKKLIQLFEAKIKNKIARVWGVKEEVEKETENMISKVLN